MPFFIPTLGVTSLLLAGASASTAFSSAVNNYSSEFDWPTMITVDPHMSASTAVSNSHDWINSPDSTTWSTDEASEDKSTVVQTIVVTARPTRTRTYTHFVTPTETTSAGDETSAVTTVVAPGVTTVTSPIFYPITSTSYEVPAFPSTTEVDISAIGVAPCVSAVTGLSTLIYTVNSPWTRTYTQVFTVETSTPCGAPDDTTSTETEISATTVAPGVSTITHFTTIFHTVTTLHTLTPTSTYSKLPVYSPGNTTSAKTKTKTKEKTCRPHKTSLVTLTSLIETTAVVTHTLIPPVETTAVITQTLISPIESTEVVTHTLIPPVEATSLLTWINPPPAKTETETSLVTHTLIPPVQSTPPYPTYTNTDAIATSFGNATGSSTVGTTSKYTSTVTTSASAPASASASAHYSSPPINGGNIIALGGAGVLMALCGVAGAMAVL